LQNCGVSGSVVDQDVEATELLADLREDALDLLHLADVAGDGGGLTALGGDGVGHGLAAVDLTAGHDHVSTLLGQQLGDGLADAAAGAGNEGDLAVEVEQLGLGHCDYPGVREWICR
jgi:hypothetical protein